MWLRLLFHSELLHLIRPAETPVFRSGGGSRSSFLGAWAPRESQGLLTIFGILRYTFPMDRTMVVQLNPSPEHARILKQTLEQHTVCFNEVARRGFTQKCSNGVELHKQTYYPLRAQYPDLPAQLVCAARVKATEAVKSALTWQKKHDQAYPKKLAQALQRGKPAPQFKPVKCPHSGSAPIRYDQRSSWVKWQTNTASLATVAGRVECSFSIPKHAVQYAGHKVCSADLCYRTGRYFLHIVVSISAPSVPPTEEVIGVDLGLNRPAVTSTRHFLG